MTVKLLNSNDKRATYADLEGKLRIFENRKNLSSKSS